MIVFEAPSRVLTLRSPKLRNTFQIDTRVVIKRAMSGKVYTYKKTPSIFQLRWDFEAITREKTLETIIFLKRTAGQQVRVTTHDNQLWIGQLINQFEMVGVGICNNQFTLMFEGFQYSNQ